jgi:transposase-like protein
MCGLCPPDRMDVMPKKFPPEFKADVARVARRGDMTLAEVAADFDVSLESVRRWKRQAEIDDGVVEGRTSAEQSELVQLRRDKRRLEQEVEILRRATAYFAKDAAPK